MDIFCDTNLLVAAAESTHPHHLRAQPIVESVIDGTHQGFASTHSIAEMYAALTRMPVSPKIHPQDAKRLVEVNILPNFHLINLEPQDYVHAMARVAELGFPGARIYDALILRCAVKSGASRLYTFNMADFAALKTPEMRLLVCCP